MDLDPAFAQVGSDGGERKRYYPMQGSNPDCLYCYAPVVEDIPDLLTQSIGNYLEGVWGAGGAGAQAIYGRLYSGG